MLTGNAILIYWIVVAVITVVLTLIHMGIACEEFTIDIDDFFESFAWITFLASLTIGGAVFGFLNWYIWATLLILLTVIPAEIILAIEMIRKRKKEEKEEEELEKEQTDEEQIAYTCPNCGAKITKITTTDTFGKRTEKYVCKHCGTAFTKKQLLSIENPSIEVKDFDLDDWEEEYFDACTKLFFKPHNHHTIKQLERKVESIQETIDNGDDVYNSDEYDDEEILEDAYNFFTQNAEEIEDYLNKYQEKEIRSRYDYYCSLQK